MYIGDRELLEYIDVSRGLFFALLYPNRTMYKFNRSFQNNEVIEQEQFSVWKWFSESLYKCQLHSHKFIALFLLTFDLISSINIIVNLCELEVKHRFAKHSSKYIFKLKNITFGNLHRGQFEKPNPLKNFSIEFTYYWHALFMVPLKGTDNHKHQ